MLFKTLLFTATLMLAFQFSSADFNLTQCYQCEFFDHEMADSNKLNDERCKENPPPKEFLVNCQDQTESVETHWQCIKVTGRIEIDEENFNYVGRKCSPGRTYVPTKDCKDVKVYQVEGYGYIKRGKHCVCDNDNGCNTAPGISISVATLAIGFLFAALSKFC